MAIALELPPASPEVLPSAASDTSGFLSLFDLTLSSELCLPFLGGICYVRVCALGRLAAARSTGQSIRPHNRV